MSDEKEIIEILENLAVDKYIDERKLEEKDIEAIINIIVLYRQEKEKNKKAIDFINDKNNYFEDGENWQNILKIKDILEE